MISLMVDVIQIITSRMICRMLRTDPRLQRTRSTNLEESPFSKMLNLTNFVNLLCQCRKAYDGSSPRYVVHSTPVPTDQKGFKKYLHDCAVRVLENVWKSHLFVVESFWSNFTSRYKNFSFSGTKWKRLKPLIVVVYDSPRSYYIRYHARPSSVYVEFMFYFSEYFLRQIIEIWEFLNSCFCYPMVRIELILQYHDTPCVCY